MTRESKSESERSNSPFRFPISLSESVRRRDEVRRILGDGQIPPPCPTPPPRHPEDTEDEDQPETVQSPTVPSETGDPIVKEPKDQEIPAVNVPRTPTDPRAPTSPRAPRTPRTPRSPKAPTSPRSPTSPKEKKKRLSWGDKLANLFTGSSELRSTRERKTR